MDIRTLPTHPGTGLTAIGVTKHGEPIWPIFGAAEEGDSDADADDAEDADEPDEDADDADGEEQTDTWTPPTKEEWDKQLAKLKRANDQAKRLREAQKATGGPKPGPPPAKAAPAKKAAPAAEAEPEEPAAQDDGELEKWQVRAIRADAKAALMARGCDPKMVNLALGQLNPTEVEWQGDDPFLDDWLDELEETYPALFAKPAAATKASPRRPGSVDQGAGANGTPAEKVRPYGEAVLARGGFGREKRTGGIASRRG
jgi:hypothetical protein